MSTIQKNFWNLVELGSEIRKLHLLEEISNKDLQTKYPVAGNNVVAKPTFLTTENFSKENFSKENFGKVSNFAEVKNAPEVENLTGKVFINETQYFDNVPETAWNFYIGVEDIDRARDAVAANGGTITSEPMEIPGGEYAMNGIDPQAWLADVIARIADLPVSRLPELLPWNWNQPEGRSAEAA